MLAAYYVFMTHIGRALELGRDDEFLGWKLENRAWPGSVLDNEWISSIDSPGRPMIRIRRSIGEMIDDL